jgi:hypothetical protein
MLLVPPKSAEKAPTPHPLSLPSIVSAYSFYLDANMLVKNAPQLRKTWKRCIAKCDLRTNIAYTTTSPSLSHKDITLEQIGMAAAG